MDVVSSLKFARREPKWKNEKAFTLSYAPALGVPVTNVTYEAVSVVIEDVRPMKATLSLQEEGFQILNLKSQLVYADFFDKELVKAVFAEELRIALLELLSARGVYFHETVIRSRVIEFPSSNALENLKYEQPIPMAHIDYTVEQVRELIKEIAGIEVSEEVRVQALK